MNSSGNRGTLLTIVLIEERYGRSLVGSFFLHIALFLLIAFGAYLLPRPSPIVIGSGLGGGSGGGEAYTVGVTDELSGGAGMIKPSLIPQPPAIIQEKPGKETPKPEAIPLPQVLEPRKPLKKAQDGNQRADRKGVPDLKPGIIPTAPEKGSGGQGGKSGGEGGGFGGGIGVSIGSGTGTFGNSWYAQAVERRISSNWMRPPPGTQIEIVYSFYIAGNGQIYDVKQVKSSGNSMLDDSALRAIQASNPLAPPPPEFQGRPIQFLADFKYPPAPQELF
jgi:TonB family protein